VIACSEREIEFTFAKNFPSPGRRGVIRIYRCDRVPTSAYRTAGAEHCAVCTVQTKDLCKPRSRCAAYIDLWCRLPRPINIRNITFFCYEYQSALRLQTAEHCGRARLCSGRDKGLRGQKAPASLTNHVNDFSSGSGLLLFCRRSRLAKCNSGLEDYKKSLYASSASKVMPGCGFRYAPWDALDL